MFRNLKPDSKRRTERRQAIQEGTSLIFPAREVILKDVGAWTGGTLDRETLDPDFFVTDAVKDLKPGGVVS